MIRKFKEFKKYKLAIKFMHGDADLYTKKKIEEDDEDIIRKYINFYIEVMHFVPNCAYGDLGYYEPYNGGDGSDTDGSIINSIAEKYDLEAAEMIETDNGGGDYFCKIEDLKLYVNYGKDEIDVLDTAALNTNIITLPKVGEDITISTGHISGGDIDGYDTKDFDYFLKKGVGTKNKYADLHGKVEKIIMSDDECDMYYFKYNVIIKLDTGEFVYTYIYGYDPSIPYNKDEFFIV